MSQHPNAPTYEPPPSNGLGVAGFVVSLTGLVACGGFACPIGLVLSLIALRKPPRGLAVGGVVLGLIGSGLAVLLTLMFVGAIGSGFSLFNGQWQTSMVMSSASHEIDNHFANNADTLPDEATGNSLLSGYNDHWNTPLRYRPLPGSQNDYELISAGPDTQYATQDDITQIFTAFNFHTPGNNVNPFADDGPSDTQVAFAFNQAAETLNAAFPSGAALPTAEAGTAAIGDQRDAWGTHLQYNPTDNPPWYHLKSAGPDGAWGTDDDDVRTFYFDPSGP